MRAHKTTEEKIHEFSHSCLLVGANGAFMHSWQKEKCVRVFRVFRGKNKKTGKRRQATAVEKIHEFSHSCLFVNTVGAFVHSWLLKCKHRRCAAKSLCVLASLRETKNCKHRGCAAKVIAGITAGSKYYS